MGPRLVEIPSLPAPGFECATDLSRNAAHHCLDPSFKELLDRHRPGDAFKIAQPGETSLLNSPRELRGQHTYRGNSSCSSPTLIRAERWIQGPVALGGLVCSSDEGPVPGLQRGGQVGQYRFGTTGGAT